MSSKVNNLRAMFEHSLQKDSNEPERGRSPADAASRGSSPRPFSKVRSSFVSVIGQPEGSQPSLSRDSSVSVRKLSGDASVATPPPKLEKPSMLGEPAQIFAAAQVAPLQSEIKEETWTDSKQTATIAKTEPDKKANLEMKPSPFLGGSQQKHSAMNSDIANANGLSDIKDKGKKAGKEASKTLFNETNGKVTSKVGSVPSKTTTPKTHPTPPTDRAPKGSTTPKISGKKETTTPKATSSMPSTNTTPKASGSVSKKPPMLQSPPSAGAGFVKPKVKSPTRPVQLPPSLTTHTAASGSKIIGGTAQRPSSRASTSTAAITGNRAGPDLTRQKSTVSSRTRPTLGPPPKLVAKDHPQTRREKEQHVDEGFLARMMRPTAASSSKTIEKVPVTPPKKGPSNSTSAHVTGKKHISKPEFKPVAKKTTAQAFAYTAAPRKSEKSEARCGEAPKAKAPAARPSKFSQKPEARAPEDDQPPAAQPVTPEPKQITASSDSQLPDEAPQLPVEEVVESREAPEQTSEAIKNGVALPAEASAASPDEHKERPIMAEVASLAEQAERAEEIIAAAAGIGDRVEELKALQEQQSKAAVREERPEMPSGDSAEQVEGMNLES